MPVILFWNTAAAPYTAQFGRWLNEMARSTLLLEEWLKKRVPEAERIDRLTAGFKIFRFYNTALTARVADAQFGELLTAPVAGVGAHVERALGQWDIPRDVRTQARSASLPSELLRVLEEMTVGILSSLRRFEKVTPEMFDPRHRTASDLIGLGALTFRTIGAGRNDLFEAAKRLKAGLQSPESAEQAAARAGSAGAGAQPRDVPLGVQLRDYSRQIDEVARYVAGALFVIPALSALLQQIGADGLVAARYKLLEKLEEIEALAYSYRRKMFLEFRDGMAAYTEVVLQMMTRISGYVVDYIRVFTDIGIDLLRGVTDGVGAFTDQLETFWTGVTGVIDQVVAFGTAVVSIDMGEVIHLALVTVDDAISWLGFNFYDILDQPEGYDAPDQFPVTIGEIALEEGAGVQANNEIRTAIARLTAAVRGAGGISVIGPIVYAATDNKVHLHRLMSGLDAVSRALSLPRAPLAGQPVLTFDASSEPDLVKEFVTPLRDGFARAVADIGTTADTAVGGIFAAGGKALTDTAQTFSDASKAAAGKRPTALVRRLAGDPDALLKSLFGDQEQAAQESSLTPVARAFEGWLLQGGFDTVGRAAGGYLKFVLDEWLAHVAENEDTPVEVTPTSPKRLLQRARLGRVHLPELRIVARRSRIGEPLAARVAAEFRTAVQNAYRTGGERLGQYAAAAP